MSGIAAVLSHFELLMKLIKDIKFIISYVGPLFKYFRRYLNARKLRVAVNAHGGTPAREIAFLLAVIEDEKLLCAGSSFPPLDQVYRTIWIIYEQLLDLSDYSKMLNGEHSQRMYLALERFVGKWGKKAEPVLSSIACNNPNIHPKVQKKAKEWLGQLENMEDLNPSTRHEMNLMSLAASLPSSQQGHRG